jgi:hypothetical protein
MSSIIKYILFNVISLRIIAKFYSLSQNFLLIIDTCPWEFIGEPKSIFSFFMTVHRHRAFHTVAVYCAAILVVNIILYF